MTNKQASIRQIAQLIDIAKSKGVVHLKVSSQHLGDIEMVFSGSVELTDQRPEKNTELKDDAALFYSSG